MGRQKYLESKSMSIILFLFLFLLYAVIYMTKSMFSSAMATIVEEGVMTKSQTGLINAVFWFVYALFQFVGGYATDKYSPHKLMVIGISGAIVSNFIIYFNHSYNVMIVVWAFNAVIQFGLWPGLFKIISTQLEPSFRGTAVFWMLFSTSVGLGISMLTASFVNSWDDNFLVSGISLLVMLVLYLFIYNFFDKRMVVKEYVGRTGKKEEVDVVEEEDERDPMLPLLFSSGLIVLTIVCFLRCTIDNGIKMMTPVMFMESYKQLPAAISTRLGSILIIFSAFGILFAGLIQRKITRCEVKAQIIFYSLCLIPLLAVCFVGEIHYIYILIALCFTVMFVHGASPFSQSFIAINFGRYGRIGTVSGILNASTGIGNVVASYVFASMAEIMPWKVVIFCWLGMIVLCVILCMVILPRWSRFKKRNINCF